MSRARVQPSPGLDIAARCCGMASRHVGSVLAPLPTSLGQRKTIEAVGSQQLSRSMGLLVALLLSLCLLQLLPPLGAATGDRGAVVGTAGTLLWVLVHLEAGGRLITQMTRYVSQVLIWRLCFDFA